MKDIPNEYRPIQNGIMPSRVTTEGEINQVLAPWRLYKLRQIADVLWQSSYDDLVIVRTYHGGAESDTKLQRWLEINEEEDMLFDPEDAVVASPR